MGSGAAGIKTGVPVGSQHVQSEDFSYSATLPGALAFFFFLMWHLRRQKKRKSVSRGLDSWHGSATYVLEAERNVSILQTSPDSSRG